MQALHEQGVEKPARNFIVVSEGDLDDSNRNRSFLAICDVDGLGLWNVYLYPQRSTLRDRKERLVSASRPRCHEIALFHISFSDHSIERRKHPFEALQLRQAPHVGSIRHDSRFGGRDISCCCCHVRSPRVIILDRIVDDLLGNSMLLSKGYITTLSQQRKFLICLRLLQGCIRLLQTRYGLSKCRARHKELLIHFGRRNHRQKLSFPHLCSYIYEAPF